MKTFKSGKVFHDLKELLIPIHAHILPVVLWIDPSQTSNTVLPVIVAEGAHLDFADQLTSLIKTPVSSQGLHETAIGVGPANVQLDYDVEEYGLLGAITILHLNLLVVLDGLLDASLYEIEPLDGLLPLALLLKGRVQVLSLRLIVVTSVMDVWGLCLDGLYGIQLRRGQEPSCILNQVSTVVVAPQLVHTHHELVVPVRPDRLVMQPDLLHLLIALLLLLFDLDYLVS